MDDYEPYSPRTINPSQLSGLDISCTDVTALSDTSTSSSDDEREELSSSDADILVQVYENKLIIRKSVTRDKFWSIMDQNGPHDRFVDIHWSYSKWDDNIIADLKVLRNLVAHFNFYDPWPDIGIILAGNDHYPNIVSLRCVNLTEILNPVSFRDFLSRFPNLRKITFCKPSLRSCLNIRQMVSITKQMHPDLILEMVNDMVPVAN